MRSCDTSGLSLPAAPLPLAPPPRAPPRASSPLPPPPPPPPHQAPSPPLDEPATGRYAATVDPVMARAVTLFYFHIRNGSNYPSKQILAGTFSLQRNGDAITGEIALEGADFVGGARPVTDTWRP